MHDSKGTWNGSRITAAATATFKSGAEVAKVEVIGRRARPTTRARAPLFARQVHVRIPLLSRIMTTRYAENFNYGWEVTSVKVFVEFTPHWVRTAPPGLSASRAESTTPAVFPFCQFHEPPSDWAQVVISVDPKPVMSGGPANPRPSSLTVSSRTPSSTLTSISHSRAAPWPAEFNSACSIIR
jgi:hypothetical protein